MRPTATPRCITCGSLATLPLLCALACLPLGAQTAPPQPTASALPAMPPTAAAPASQAAPPHHAEVAFADGQLTVRADNSSLHQILSSIAHLTGMTITGGVTDQRVFGSYGPGDASTILATLLDGTGVNMLIREGQANQPTELILSPRSGAPGPAITAQDALIGTDQPVPATNGVHTLAPGASMQVTVPQPAAQSHTDAATTPAPSGTLTPEQVYQKMLQMQKAKDAAAAPSASGKPI